MSFYLTLLLTSTFLYAKLTLIVGTQQYIIFICLFIFWIDFYTKPHHRQYREVYTINPKNTLFITERAAAYSTHTYIYIYTLRWTILYKYCWNETDGYSLATRIILNTVTRIIGVENLYEKMIKLLWMEGRHLKVNLTWQFRTINRTINHD